MLSNLILTLLLAAGGAEGIHWFGSYAAGQEIARETGRPILLVAATPHCHNVPGRW